jgi:hypothetical protein
MLMFCPKIYYMLVNKSESPNKDSYEIRNFPDFNKDRVFITVILLHNT